MKKIKLKNTGLKVSKLCFGTGRMEKFTSKAGAELILKAYKRGVNFWDTSDNYGTHRHVKAALKKANRKNVILMTKITNTFGEKRVKKHVKKMLKELGTKYLDILLLHSVDSEKELEKYLGIIPFLKEMKSIKHIGLSSHKPNIIKKVAKNKDIEFILAPYNYKGFRIMGVHNDKTFLVRRGKMRRALKKCKKYGKDIFLIKLFAHGMIDKIGKAIRYGLNQKFSDGVNLGFEKKKEVNENIRIVNKFFKNKKKKKKKRKKRKWLIFRR